MGSFIFEGRYELKDMFRTEPAYMTSPGVTVTNDGIIFAAVFREALPCGIVLYHVSDGSTVKIPFTNDCRLGSLYSVRVTGLDPALWGYRLYAGERTFLDPSARQLLSVKAGKEEIAVSGFYYRPDDRLVPDRSFVPVPWQDELIYSFHVRGFTMNAPEGVLHPGTFQGAAERIPYLQSLGVTAVEIMPLYELYEPENDNEAPRTMEEALRLYPVSVDGMPVRDLDHVSVNYWGYGRGYYFAPRRAYATAQYPGGPQKELADMVDSFHRAGIAVYLQLFFTASESSEVQSQIGRYYVTHYNVDGFRLMGHIADLNGFASDPLLSDTRIIAGAFPYNEILREDTRNPGSGVISIANRADCSGEFSDLIRHFVKSDDYALHPFLRAFLGVPAGHGNIHYVCSSNGFTLRDLVSYNERHNGANGEGGLDGRENNISWNCGAEGETDREDVLTLRRGQIRNFLTLLFLSQGTLLLSAGDECLNTQGGNNNPYCQDNETGWTDWPDTKESAELTEFVRKLSAFRRAHKVFRMDRPFTGTDSLACGFPDLSFHGAEAWKPDFSDFSHTIGICLCENYCEDREETELIYIAVNMHWVPQPLGLPKVLPRRQWAVVIDTSQEDAFLQEPLVEDDQHFSIVRPRSVKILRTVNAPKRVRRRKKNMTEETRDEQTFAAKQETGQQDHTAQVSGASSHSEQAQIPGDEGLLCGGTVQTGPVA